MAEVKIPIFAGVFDTDDNGITSSTDDYRIRNGYVDKNRTLHKRPVMRESGTNNPTGRDIIGLYWWPDKDYFIAMIMGSGSTSVDVYKIEITVSTGSKYPSVSAYTLIGNIPSATRALADNFRPSFALAPLSGAEVLYMCVAGLELYYTDGSTLTDVSAIGGNPANLQTVSDVQFLNNRVLALVKDSQTVQYSVSSGDTSDFNGTGSGSFTAESNPDKVQRMFVIGQEIVLVGTDTIDYYYDTGDSTTPFARYEGGELPFGISDRGLAVLDDRDLYIMDNSADMKIIRDKQYQNITLPYAERIDELTDTTDAYAQVFKYNSKKFINFTFPNGSYVEGTYIGDSFIFDAALKKWYQWGNYNFLYDTALLDDLPMLPYPASAFCTKTNIQYVAGDEMRHFHETLGHSDLETLVVTSAAIDLDTHKRKASHRITGRVWADTDDITLRYRETLIGGNSWITVNSNPNYTTRTITPPTDYFLKEHRLGQYRIRQYQIRHQTGEFHMGDLTEEVEVLGS